MVQCCGAVSPCHFEYYWMGLYCWDVLCGVSTETECVCMYRTVYHEIITNKNQHARTLVHNPHSSALPCNGVNECVEANGEFGATGILYVPIRELAKFVIHT